MWGTRKGQHACLFIETLHRHISQQWHTIASSDTHLGFRVQGLWFMYTGTSRDSDTPLPPPTLLESLAASVFRTTARNTPTRQSVKQAKDKARRGARTHASKEGDPSVASSAFFLIFSHVPSKLHAYYVYDARAPNALAQEIGRRV